MKRPWRAKAACSPSPFPLSHSCQPLLLHTGSFGARRPGRHKRRHYERRASATEELVTDQHEIKYRTKHQSLPVHMARQTSNPCTWEAEVEGLPKGQS